MRVRSCFCAQVLESSIYIYLCDAYEKEKVDFLLSLEVYILLASTRIKLSLSDRSIKREV